MGGDITQSVFTAFDANGEHMNMLDFIRALKGKGVSNTSIVSFLKSLRHRRRDNNEDHLI